MIEFFDGQIVGASRFRLRTRVLPPGAAQESGGSMLARFRGLITANEKAPAEKSLYKSQIQQSKG